MIDTLIALGMFSVLIYIATKIAVVNDVSHEIRDILIGWRPPPPSAPYDAEKHEACYPTM